MDRVNTGPATESRIRYEKQVVALALVRELLQDTGIEGIAMQHSSDVIMLYRVRKPKIVSIKHRDPNRSSGDSGWGLSQLKDDDVLSSLYRWWSDADERCQPAFWSNAGFVREARKYHASIVEDAGPSPDFVQWLARHVKVSAADARRFLRELELLAEPMPRRNEIPDSGAAAVAKLLEARERDAGPLFARECFDALCTRIIELSADPPAPPPDDSRLELVHRLLPRLDTSDAAALASRLLPVAEAEAIVLREHDRRVAKGLPEVGFRWEADARFVGRADVLSELARLLDPGGVTPVAPVVVRGMTGCGKTSLAIQFAAHQSNVMCPVFVNADSRANLVAVLQQICHTPNDLQTNGIADARTPVTPALPSTSGTLLILDGVVDPETVRGLIPRRSLCRVLITTTVANLDTGYQELPLEPWQPHESRSFLEAHLPHATTEDRDRLRQELHDHPLALNQAVDHCRVVDRTISDYITRLREAPTQTLRLGRASGHPVSTIESIRMNIEAAEAIEPDSTTLLTVLAFLGPAPLPESRFDSPIGVAAIQPPTRAEVGERRKHGLRWFGLRRTRPLPPDTTEPLTTSAADDIRDRLRNRRIRDRAIEILARMSLITARRGQLSVHPLIALVAQSRVEDQRPWLEVCIGLFLSQQARSFADPTPELDENVGPAAHVTATAFDLGFTGTATILMASLLTQRLALVGPNESATSRGWTAVDFGEHGVREAMKNAAITGDPVWQLVAANVRASLAQAYSLAGRVDDAFYEIGDNIIAGHGLRDMRLIAEAVVNAEAVATTHGRRDQAEHVLARIEELFALDFDAYYQTGLLISKANMLRILNRADEAAAAIGRAIEMIASREAELPPLLAVKAYGAASVIARDHDDPLSSLKSELSILEIQRRRDSHTNISPTTRVNQLLSGGDAAITANRLDLARTLVEEAEEIAREYQLDRKSIVYANIHAIRGRLLFHESHLGEARTDLEKAIAIFREMPSGFRPSLSAPLYHLAQVLHAQGHREKAIISVTEAYNIDCEIYGPKHKESLRDRDLLNLLGDAGDPSDWNDFVKLFGSHPFARDTAVDNESRVSIDITRVILNSHRGMEQIDTNPSLEWSISDFASESELAILFSNVVLGAVIISSTLDSALQLLTARFGVERVSRPILPTFDLNEATGLALTYSREAHEFARTLLNTTLVNQAEVEPDSPLFDIHADPEFLIQTWIVVIVTYSFINAVLHTSS